MSDVYRKPLREQIMFHLSFIPDITVKEARIENEMKISLQ